MNRNPPTSVMRALRQEVGFGCPVRRAGKPCGNPYLAYHHFDPPWSVHQHHNIEGMIALCAEHHAKADAGAFSLEHLRKLKADAAQSGIKGHFDWLLRDFVVVTGGAYAANTTIPISYGDRPVISFMRNQEGLLLMNLDMPTASLSPRLRMWESSWYERGDPKDLESPPSGRLLKVHYKNGDYLRIEFKPISTKADFLSQYPNLVDVGPLGFTYPATAIEIELRLTEGDVHINKNTFKVAGTELQGVVHSGGPRFIGIGTHEPLTPITDFVSFSRKQVTPRLHLASQNTRDFLTIDGMQFVQQVVSLDGYEFVNCTFVESRLMFSGRSFRLSGCGFCLSTLVLTDEAVQVSRTLDVLRREAELDVATVLEKLSASSL